MQRRPGVDTIFETGRAVGISRGVINGVDRIWVWNYDGSAGSITDIIEIEYTPKEWVHISMVHGGGRLKAYKNGVLVGNVPN